MTATIPHLRPTMEDRARVTIGIPQPGDVWDTARWDTARWDRYMVHPVDVSPDVAGFTVTIGRDGPTGHVRPAELKLELSNESGAYTPWYDTPQHRRRWWLGAPLTVETLPGELGTGGKLYTGHVTAVEELDAPMAPFFRSVIVTGAGNLGYLAAANDVEQPPAGAHEHARERLERIFDHAGLPEWVPVDLDAGRTTLQATTLAKAALEEAWLTADSDGGALLELPDGTIRYVDPHTFDNDPRYTAPVVTFGDSYPGTEVNVENFTVALATDAVYNRVGIAHAGGTTRWASAPADEWAGVRSFTRTDLIHETDEQSQWLADVTLERLSHRELLVTPLTFDPLLDPVCWQAAHTLQPMDRVQLLRWRDNRLLRLAATVDQITHQITADSWTEIVTLSPGSQDFDYTRWDTARWDTDRWE